MAQEIRYSLIFEMYILASDLRFEIVYIKVVKELSFQLDLLSFDSLFCHSLTTYFMLDKLLKFSKGKFPHGWYNAHAKAQE